MLVIPFFIQHQGCPHRCLFCNQWAIAGEGTAGGDDPVHDLRRTIATWLGYRRSGMAVELAFFGGSFSCLEEPLQQRLLAAVQPYLHEGKIDSVRVSTRPDCLDRERIDFLRAYGVRTVEIGAQSLQDQVLRQARRGHTAADVEAAMASLSGSGCRIGLQLMIGLPGETTGSFFRGIERVIALRPHFVRLYPTLAMSGTGLADLHRQGRWRPLSLSRAVILAGRARSRLLAAGIGVVRLGLQPSADLERHLVAGPYHPAFGELVLSRDWYRRIRPLLRAAGPGRRVEITISPRDRSACVGPRQENLQRLRALPSAATLSLRTDAGLERGQIHHVIR